VTGYYRISSWDMQTLPGPYIKSLRKHKKDIQPFIERDDKSENAFHQLKKALLTAPTLGLPVQDKFQLYVYEKGRLALGVVTQLRAITPQSVGYLSKELNQIAKGWPG
jgi:hypothetical protein